MLSRDSCIKNVLLIRVQHGEITVKRPFKNPLFQMPFAIGTVYASEYELTTRHEKNGHAFTPPSIFGEEALETANDNRVLVKTDVALMNNLDCALLVKFLLHQVNDHLTGNEYIIVCTPGYFLSPEHQRFRSGFFGNATLPSDLEKRIVVTTECRLAYRSLNSFPYNLLGNTVFFIPKGNTSVVLLPSNRPLNRHSYIAPDQTAPFGFDDVTNYFIKLLCEKGYDLTSSNARTFCEALLKKHCFCAIDYDAECEALEKNNGVYAVVELPDGTTMELGKECFQAPEALFRPSLIGFEDTEGCINLICNFVSKFIRAKPLTVYLIVDHIIPGMKERLQSELTRRLVHMLGSTLYGKNLPEIIVRDDLTTEENVNNGALHITHEEARNEGRDNPGPFLAVGRPYHGSTSLRNHRDISFSSDMSTSLLQADIKHVEVISLQSDAIDSWALLPLNRISIRDETKASWVHFVNRISSQDKETNVTRWSQAGQGEHASVASFAKFTLELMCAGAPPALLRWAQEAATEEIEHAQLSFGMASRFDFIGNTSMPASSIVPGPFPVHKVDIGNNMARFAETVLKEGVIGETISAVEMGIRRDATVALKLPLLPDVLQILLKDETSHSLLAWNTLAWLIHRNHDLLDSVRFTLENEIHCYLSRHLDVTQSDDYLKVSNMAPEDMVDSYGWLDDEWRFMVGLYCLKSIIEPTLEALAISVSVTTKPDGIGVGNRCCWPGEVDSRNDPAGARFFRTKCAEPVTSHSQPESGIEYVKSRIAKFAANYSTATQLDQ